MKFNYRIVCITTEFGELYRADYWRLFWWSPVKIGMPQHHDSIEGATEAIRRHRKSKIKDRVVWEGK